MMKGETKKRVVVSNLIWRFAERCGAQGVSFVVSIVLARLLEPEYYSSIALVTVFINILQVFVDSGLGNALIQKKEADDLDFSSVFYFNVVVCIALYVGMFFLAPFIASFYERPELISVIRVLSVTIIISGLKNVQQAFVSRNMMFKRFFFATLFGTIGAAVIGIILAYKGFGIWALVAQQMFNVTVDTLILWITVKWRPKRMFSFRRVKSLFAYGWKLLVSQLIDTVYNDLRQLIIGKMYSSSDLAFYNKGKQFPNLIVNNLNTSINSVLFPVMAKEQDDSKKVKSMTRKSIRISIFVLAPIMIGLSVTSEILIPLLLTEKWIECIPYLRIFCISYLFYPIHTANLSAIKAMGRSDLFLKLEIIKKAIGLILLFASMKYGVLAMAYSLLVSTFTSQIVNAWPNRKLLNYGYFEQIKDMLPSILLASFMGCVVWLIGHLQLPSIFVLLIQIVCGVIVYLLGSIIFKIDSFEYLVSLIAKKKRINKE